MSAPAYTKVIIYGLAPVNLEPFLHQLAEDLNKNQDPRDARGVKRYVEGSPTQEWNNLLFTHTDGHSAFHFYTKYFEFVPWLKAASEKYPQYLFHVIWGETQNYQGEYFLKAGQTLYDERSLFGSAQEFVETRISGCFLKNDEFCFCDRHALCL
jgi:hypothetical protein